MSTPGGERGHLRLVEPARPQEVLDADEARQRRPAEPELEYIGEIDDDAAQAELPRPPPFSPRFAVLALLAFQAIGVVSYLGKYVELTRTETVSPAAAILSLPAVLALFLGAVLSLLRPGRGRALFIVAAVGLGIAVPFWGISYGWTWPVAAGSVLGLAGAWAARAAARQNSPQP